LLLATVSCLVVEPIAASAQSAPDGYGQGGYGQASGPPQSDSWPAAPPPGEPYAQAAPPSDPGPPPSRYAPPSQYTPPPQYAPSYQGSYAQSQARYDQWAAQNCISQHNSNIAAGAIFGGAAGALMGFSLAGWAARGAWALFGGTMGATLGATVGSSANNANCQTAAWAGPPPYAGPAYAAPYGPVYGPGPAYRRGPWVWAGDHWVRRPHRYGGWGYRPAGYAY
jgi:hypothetical protein